MVEAEKRVEKKSKKVRKLIKEDEKVKEKTEEIRAKRAAEVERRRKISENLRKRKGAKGIPKCIWTNKGNPAPVVWKRVAGKMAITSG